METTSVPVSYSEAFVLGYSRFAGLKIQWLLGGLPVRSPLGPKGKRKLALTGREFTLKGVFMKRIRTVVTLLAVFSLFLVLNPADAEAADKPAFTWTNGELTVNGSRVELPCDLSVLTAAIGEPDRKPEGGLTGKEATPIWDNLGIVCHLNEDGTVKDISFRLGANPRGDGGPFAPKKTFTGDLTVDGVKLDGAVTFDEFWEKRQQNGKKLRGGEYVEYENGTALYLTSEEPAKGRIWRVAVGVRSRTR
jgi:hypothetical protein